MKAFKKVSASVTKRPHLGASQRKYVYEVTVGELTFAPGSSDRLPTGPVCVLWTRGSKTAITSEHKLDATRSIAFDQPLSLICTLFLDAGSFAEKLCTFAVIEQGGRGAHTVGKCKVDMAPYADVQSTSAKPLTLTLRKGAVAVATLRLSITSRWLKDYQIDDDAETISSVGTDDFGDSSCRTDDLNPDDWPEEPSPPPPGQTPASSPPPAVTPTTPELAVAAAASPAATPASASADPSHSPAPAVSVCAVSAPASSATAAMPDAAAAPAAEAPTIRKLNLVAASSAAPDATSQANAPQPTQLPPPVTTDASGLIVLSTAKAATISGRGGGGSSSAAATAGGAATLGAAVGGLPILSTAKSATCGAGGSSSAAAAAGSTPEAMLDLSGLADVRVAGGPGGRRATVSGMPTAAAGGGRLDSPARATFSSSTFSGAAGAAAAGGGAVQARAEAERKEMEAQLSAATALKNKMHQRYEEAQQEWEKERAALRESVAQLQQQLVATEGRERQQAQTAQTATAQLHEARAEAKRLRQEKDEAALEATSAGGNAAGDDNDHLALEAARQDLQSKLDRSEQHREEVARKLGKARKHQQNQLAQYEAEICMLSDKVELMEDEIGDEIQARLELQTQLEQEQKKVEGMAAELQDVRDRQARRAHILPEGVQELHDQLEMAHSVRATLCADIAKLTEELVEAKLLAAQESERSETLEGKLRRAGEKQRMLSVRMTELEMMVEDGKTKEADNEEQIAEAFKEVMKEQELKILALEEQLHEARTNKPAASGSTASTPRSEGKSRFGLPKLG